jgi:hypothetical protein
MKWTPIPLCLPLLAAAAILAGCAEDKETNPPPPPGEPTYVGAQVCQGCHAAIYNTVNASGHPHKVTPVVNGQRPGAPLQLPDNPPAGLTWSQIKYVVGGWGWKARFVTMDDQVVVGEGVQYNIATEQFPSAAWANYNVGKPTAYNYACFRCHTTGPVEATNTFHQSGIQCEACHGKGSVHAESQSPGDIETDDSAELCGRCHYRDEAKVRIIAGGGFINHHEQYEELKDGRHAGLKCVDCHDYHEGVRRGQNGIVKTCTQCHTGMQTNHNSAATCVDCHMPYVTKSARPVNKYQGDVRTHIFTLRTGTDTQDTMFETVGTNTYVKQDYGVTLDFACYTCHQDAEGVGGSMSARTMAELSALAQTMHGDKTLAAR